MIGRIIRGPQQTTVIRARRPCKLHIAASVMSAAIPHAARLQQQPSIASVEDFRIAANIEIEEIQPELRKSCILFYAPETEVLARKIAGD